jgi:GT2 family glycosyltransferase
MIDSNGTKLGYHLYPSSFHQITKRMKVNNAIAHGTVMMRRSVFELIGGYDEGLRKAEDYELWMRAIKRGIKIANIREPLVSYRIPDISKRDITNWIDNLKVKLRYFSVDHIGYRMVGILLVTLMIILPPFSKKLAYSIYSRIMARRKALP